MTTTNPEWQPGDPLHRPGNYGHYLFNFRDDTDREECFCPDAARWPYPTNHVLPDGDELGDLIAWYRANPEPVDEEVA